MAESNVVRSVVDDIMDAFFDKLRNDGKIEAKTIEKLSNLETLKSFSKVTEILKVKEIDYEAS